MTGFGGAQCPQHCARTAVSSSFLPDFPLLPIEPPRTPQSFSPEVFPTPQLVFPIHPTADLSRSTADVSHPTVGVSHPTIGVSDLTVDVSHPTVGVSHSMVGLSHPRAAVSPPGVTPPSFGGPGSSRSDVSEEGQPQTLPGVTLGDGSSVAWLEISSCSREPKPLQAGLALESWALFPKFIPAVEPPAVCPPGIWEYFSAPR